jgi:hypothetical protein
MDLPTDVLAIVINTLAASTPYGFTAVVRLRQVNKRMNALLESEQPWSLGHNDGNHVPAARGTFKSFQTYWQRQLRYRRGELRPAVQFHSPSPLDPIAATRNATTNAGRILSRHINGTEVQLWDWDTQKQIGKMKVVDQFGHFPDLTGGITVNTVAGSPSHLKAIWFEDALDVRWLKKLTVPNPAQRIQVLGAFCMVVDRLGLKLHFLNTETTFASILFESYRGVLPYCNMTAVDLEAGDPVYLTTAYSDAFSLYEVSELDFEAPSPSSVETSISPVLRVPLPSSKLGAVVASHGVSEYRHVVVSTRGYTEIDIRSNRGPTCTFELDGEVANSYCDAASRRMVVSQLGKQSLRLFDLTFDPAKFTYHVFDNFSARKLAPVVMSDTLFLACPGGFQSVSIA